MPNWKMHISLTVVCYLSFLIFFTPSIKTSIVAVIILIFSSLLPDLDHPKSKIRGFVSWASFLLVFIFLLSILEFTIFTKAILSVAGAFLVFIFVKKLPLKHRGRKSLHQWWLAIFVPLIFAFIFLVFRINPLLAFFVFFGYVVHLALDRIGF